MSPARIRILLALLLCAAPAAAQQSRYAAPGALSERQLNTRDALMKMRQDARWRLGFIDIEPQLAITDLGYVSNIYGTADDESRSDLRATGLAGLRGFFNLGPKIVVSPFASLNHAWWQDQEQLRSTNESYGIQLFGDFNRLRFAIDAGQIEAQRNLSSELEVPIDLRDSRVAVALDIDFWGPFRFFAGASTSAVRHFGSVAEENLPGLDLTALDIDNELLNAGFGYELGNGLVVSLGAERSETRYLVDPGGRSNRGSGPLARLHLDGSRLFVDLRGAWRDLEFDALEAETRREFNGFGQLGWRFTEKLSAGLFGGSQLQASAFDSQALFESRRTGVYLQRQTERGSARLFYETGEDEFASIVVDAIVRRDDFTTYGARVSLDLSPRLRVDLGVFDSRRDSTDPRFDRDFTALQSMIRLGGNLLPW